MTDAEKQTRFRKKEELKRQADKVYRLRTSSSKITKNPNEIRRDIDKAIELPGKWTDEDYQRAVYNLHLLEVEQFDNPYLLENDVNAGRNSRQEFMTTPDPVKLMAEEKAAISNTKALAEHIISACELSKCSHSDIAAALMEAARFYGKCLMNSKVVPRSRATAMCLAGIGKQYPRPDWFTEELANALAWQVHEKTVSDLGERLCNFNYMEMKEFRKSETEL
jgi:hypothetical protein